MKNMETKYIDKLNNVIDTLLAIKPDADLDERLLEAIRDVNEIKCYFKNLR